MVHLFGWTKTPRYADENAAKLALLTDYPRAKIRTVLLADDGRAALFELLDGAAYAAPFGAGRLTRVFGDGDIRRIENQSGGLDLRLNDYTAPRLRIAIGDGAKRAAWSEILKKGDDA